MKRTIIAAVFGVFASAVPALADCSQGDGALMPMACGREQFSFPEHRDHDYDRYAVRKPVRNTAPAKAAPANPCPDNQVVALGKCVVPGTGWNPYGTFNLTPSELKAQQKANQDWLVWQNAQYGGWDDDSLSFRVYSNTNRPGLGNAFGEGKQMGSNGGD